MEHIFGPGTNNFYLSFRNRAEIGTNEDENLTTNKKGNSIDDVIEIHDDTDRQNENFIPLQNELNLHQCKLCPDIYTSLPALIQHKKTVHEEFKHQWEWSFLLLEDLSETDKVCKICSEYNVHDTSKERKSKKIQPITCKMCRAVFCYVEDFQYHMIIGKSIF